MPRVARLILGVGGLILFTGCEIAGLDSEECQSGGEFASYGCAVVSGVVTDTAGLPLSSIIVGPRYLDEAHCCDTSYSSTNAEGRYSFRVNWYVPQEAGGRADSLLIYVHAQKVGVGALDSVASWVQFADVGEVAPVNRVDLVLQKYW